MGRLRRRYKQLLSDHNEKRRYWNLKKEEAVAALCRELVSEEAMDLSQDRLGNE